ncbi:MAG: DUF5690 family protein [Fimbriiglobus sp.]
MGRSLAAFLTVVAAFGTYFSVYAFRKPFTAATFELIPWYGINEKSMLVIAQTLGYMVSKFVGIRVIAEVRPEHRVRQLLIQLGLAQLTLVLFAVTPVDARFVWLFFNGLMLGMTFGLILGFLEGRQNTEALVAGLCASFILADGVMKTTGRELLDRGYSETWMPAMAGCVFMPLLLIAVWQLSRTPPPSEEDVTARSERSTMTAEERRAIVKKYGLGLALIVLAYLGITVLRSVRADFAPEIWKGLGTTVDPGLYSRSEMVVALGILICNGAIIAIKNNRIAFLTSLGTAILGVVLCLASVLLLRAEMIDAFTFMVLVGLGLYLPYIAVHTTIFERFIAMTRERGTIGYLMYLADAFGYLGYVAVLLTKNSLRSVGNMLDFFLLNCVVVGVTSLLLLIPAFWYFRRLKGTSH